MFYFDKLIVVKRYSSELGAYNRPNYELTEVGRYYGTYSQNTNNYTQKEPQKENSTGETLYLDTDADIKLGDIVYIYEIDEFDNPIMPTEYVAVADKPYLKRDHIEIPLTYREEV